MLTLDYILSIDFNIYLGTNILISCINFMMYMLYLVNQENNYSGKRGTIIGFLHSTTWITKLPYNEICSVFKT